MKIPLSITAIAFIFLQVPLHAQWVLVDGQNQQLGQTSMDNQLTVNQMEDSGIPWETGTSWKREFNLTQGSEAVRISLRARATKGKKGQYDHAMKLHVYMDGDRRPFLRAGPHVSGEWETYELTVDLPVFPEETLFRMHLAYGWGSSDIEVDNVKIFSVGKPDDGQGWRRKGHWYNGSAPDAAWRTKADALIEKYRKADATIRVIGRDGQPIPEARVVLEQQQHAYKFGTAVNTQRYRWLRDEGADYAREASLNDSQHRSPIDRTKARSDAERYFDEIVANFNYFVPENGTKAQAWAGDWAGFSISDTIAAVDYLRGQGLTGKGHVLVWPGWRNAPEFLQRHGTSEETMDALLKAHITDIGNRMSPRVVEFDVLNEAFNNNDFMKILGKDAMVEWFQVADQVLPDARLTLNDFLIVANGGRYTEKIDFYEALVTFLTGNKAPLDVIAFQNHYRHTFLSSPERTWQILDRFAKFGLPLQCSEFDVMLEDEQLQADYTRDFLTAWFAHPATDSFLFWGFWESEHWLPSAALLTADWRPKANYRAYRDLVYNQWWSGWKESKTDQAGVATQRVFLGEYKITVTCDGMEKVLTGVTVDRGGIDLTVRI